MKYCINLRKKTIEHHSKQITKTIKRIDNMEKELLKDEKRLKKYIKTKGKRMNFMKKGYIMYCGVYYNSDMEKVPKTEAYIS